MLCSNLLRAISTFRLGGLTPSARRGGNIVHPSPPGYLLGNGDHYCTIFFAASGTSTVVFPTSLISTIVVRSTSTSLPPKLTVPRTLYSYLTSSPSLSQNFTEPLALLTLGPSPPRRNRKNVLAPSSVR